MRPQIEEPKHMSIAIKVLTNVQTKCCECDCNLCLELVIDGLQNGTTCNKCYHGYFCFLFAREIRRAAYQKKETVKEVAIHQLANCARSFTAKYSSAWQEHLIKIMPNLDLMLKEGVGQTLLVYNLITEAKEKGFLKTEGESF